MTLILSLVSQFGVMQISDRMVSAAGIGAYPNSNKTVVFLARDGLVSVSYTGLARIGNVTTDDWIARRLAGVDDWGAGQRPFIIHERRPIWHDIGGAVAALVEGLNTAFANDVPRPWRTTLLELYMVGWQWKRRYNRGPRRGRARPIYWAVAKDSDGRFSSVSSFPRNEPYRRMFIYGPRSDAYGAQVANAAWQRITASDVYPDMRAMRTIFAQEMRNASARSPETIGPHCMTVCLYPPRGSITFISDPAQEEELPLPEPFNREGLQTNIMVIPSDPANPSRLAPANSAYGPWLIIGDDTVVTPALVLGTQAPFVYRSRPASRGRQFEFEVGGDPRSQVPGRGPTGWV